MTPKTQSVCKHCGVTVICNGSYWLVESPSPNQEDKICPVNPNGRHEVDLFVVQHPVSLSVRLCSYQCIKCASLCAKQDGHTLAAVGLEHLCENHSVAEPASTGEPQMSERKPNTMYCDKCNKEMPNLALGPCSCGSSTFSGTAVVGAARPSEPSAPPDYPAIPVYLRDPMVFKDANLGTAMVATWNDKQWIFRVHNSHWCSVRLANSADPLFIDPINKKPEPSSCPGCASDNAPHFAKCNKAAEPRRHDFDSGQNTQAAAPQTSAEHRPSKQRDADLIIPLAPPKRTELLQASPTAEALGGELWEQWFCRAMTSKETWRRHVMPILSKYFPAAPQPVSGPLTIDEKLVLLMEECAEVIKAASKCLRFGYTRNHPSYGDNDKVLSTEIGDLLGVVEALPLDGKLIQEARKTKIQRAEKAKVMYGK